MWFEFYGYLFGYDMLTESKMVKFKMAAMSELKKLRLNKFEQVLGCEATPPPGNKFQQVYVIESCS